MQTRTSNIAIALRVVRNFETRESPLIRLQNMLISLQLRVATGIDYTISIRSFT